EPLPHRLDPTSGGEHLVGRATDLKAFRRLDGGILQFVERGPLRRRGLDRLADAVDWQVGDAGRLLIAKRRETTSEMRSIGQSVSSGARLPQTSAARRPGPFGTAA